ncbi:carbohydrate sulfotransferase 5 [Eupeodes corollae]|uniref:carbohydrate sulfotransferase 5 n=1 Tax=Eupeodes corollae TaxID=290404 RepID=UPI0024908085|nr:carbohydrate sulfotransferase 5 [Eupeodes corollae]XP_055923816.1 carbohydrate sulfotransferase 5 [Eupeodes corollae]
MQNLQKFKTRRKIMSRRANLIGICGVSSLCILLLIATTQHRPLPASDHQITTMTETYNQSVTMVDVFANQRSKIATEMENFEYPSGRFGVDAEKLSDLTPEMGGQPVRSVVVTTWRSGSTFLGDILNAMPGNFYHYEPLLNFDIRRIRGPPDEKKAIGMLKNLLHCDYSDMGEYLEYGKEHKYLFEHNERLWAQCKEYPQFCWKAKFLTPFCKLFPLQSMKVVRLRLALAEQLLEDKSLNVRLLLLVRDPRGTMQSRKHRLWCPGNPDCDEASNLCNDLIDDYKSAEVLIKKYPSRFRTLRYEDLSVNPYEVTLEILQYFGLPFDPMVEEFLDTHTKLNIGGVSSTFRDSKSAPFHWKNDLSIEEIENIQETCTKAMELWGYRHVDTSVEFTKSFDPLILPAPFS